MSIDFSDGVNNMYEDDGPIVSSTVLKSDEQEASLRPSTLSEYVGQVKAKENLSVFIESAKRRGEPLDHVLLHGPPGLGKTTLASIIAAEMGVTMRKTSGPAIEKPKDLAALLTNLNENDILFIDEIHRMNRAVEEILYPAMEDKHIDIIFGQGPTATSICLELKNFTLVGATTRSGQLSSPLRDRFGIDLKLELYSPEELQLIVARSASILKRVRDFAQVFGDGTITKDIANLALTRLEIDKCGLDSMDRRLLRSIIENYGGGPVGLETIAATINEEPVTIEDVCEPYLMQQGYLTRTPRGRCATKKAYLHLGIESDRDDDGQVRIKL